MLTERFRKDFLDLLLEKNTAHMGMHLYEDHAGRRGDESMSGAKLWEDLANREPNYTIARSDVKLLQNSIQTIAEQLPPGLNLIDLGPGAEESIRSKSMKILGAIQARSYQPVDGSPTFAATAAKIAKEIYPSVEVFPTIDDAFSIETDAAQPSLTYFGGGTLANLIHPASADFPEHLLAAALVGIARHNAEGWTLLSFDSLQDAETIMRAYACERTKKFVANIMYRAKAELQLETFNPELFEASPLWIKESFQLAYFLTATEDQRFSLSGAELFIRKGQKFHIINSYKYTPGLFKKVAAQAGLCVKYLTTDFSGVVLVLLRNALAA